MANHKSALKRARQNEKRNLRNRSVRSEARTAMAVVRQRIEDKAGKEGLGTSVSQAVSSLAKAVRKGAVHWKTAARKTSRLQKAANKFA